MRLCPLGRTGITKLHIFAQPQMIQSPQLMLKFHHFCFHLNNQFSDSSSWEMRMPSTNLQTFLTTYCIPR
ncbi:hypothetical protein HanRHA438_Chr06g0260841 [Helianthus annuus]|nr:hypothetical protein HanRHA438_Chr06g0260841 [Helianthus annuus]